MQTPINENSLITNELLLTTATGMRSLTVHEVACNTDPRIQHIAEELGKNKKEKRELAKLLCEYVIDNIKEGISNEWNLPINVLIKGRGDCKDKAVLLVSLLRSLGVDSRLVIGLIGTKYRGTPVAHVWVLYLGDGERAIFDPSLLIANGINEKEYFERVKGYFVFEEF